jgi:hypothetical protein
MSVLQVDPAEATEMLGSIGRAADRAAADLAADSVEATA